MNRVILPACLLALGALSVQASNSTAGDSFKPLKMHHTHATSGGQADAYAHQKKTASPRKSQSQTAGSTCRKTGKAEGLTDAALRTFVSDCMKQQSQSSMSSDTTSPS